MQGEQNIWFKQINPKLFKILSLMNNGTLGFGQTHKLGETQRLMIIAGPVNCGQEIPCPAADIKGPYCSM